MALLRLAWAEISKEKLLNNIKIIRSRIEDSVGLMAVVKANAYGHGAVEIAKIAENDVDRFGVSAVIEAVSLRKNGIEKPIVILGYTPVENFQEIIDYNLIPTIKNLDVAKALVTAARRQEKNVKVWVKVDSGMHRLGLEPSQVLIFIRKLQDLPNLEVEGLFTHFADVDNDSDFTDLQLQNFQEVVDELDREGVRIPIKSAGASGAIFAKPLSHFNMVRAGLSLYGVNPDKKTIWSPELKPILDFKTEVTQIHELSEGESVGYGRTYEAQGNVRIATLAVGYGDGFRRAPFNWGQVLIKGHLVPLAGRVSMDQAAIDITSLDSDIRVGEEVVLIGQSGKEEITAADVAEKLQTSAYEVLTSLSSRVERVYK